MIDTIKKTLLAGVGAAVVTKDKVEAALEDFVKQGKVSSGEARAMAEKIAAEGVRGPERTTQRQAEGRGVRPKPKHPGAPRRARGPGEGP